MRPAAELLACDLDETLVTVNTFPRFVLFALRQLAAQRDVRGCARLAGALARRKGGRLSHDAFKEQLADAALRIDPPALRRWCRATLAAHLNADVARLVAGWQGPRLLCTAAPETYAAVIADELGFDLVHGSRRWPAGFVNNAGPAKAGRIRDEIPNPVGLVITDDDVLDAPLLALGRRRIVVRDGVLDESAAG